MTPDTGVHQFQLTDAQGRLHDYIVTEHPGGDGMGIMFELLALGAPTVMSLAGAAMQSEEVIAGVLGALRGDGADEMGTAGSEGNLAKLLGTIDLASVGGEIGKALSTGQAPGLTRKVLSHAYRDGKPLSAHLDLAYQANYLELLTALWRVCTINRFFPVPSTLLGSSSEQKVAAKAGASAIAG